MPGTVVEGTQIGSTEGVVFQFLAVVEVTVARDVAVAECQAEGIVVRALKHRATVVHHRSYVAQMVGKIELRRIGPSCRVPCQLAVRRQDVIDGKTKKSLVGAYSFYIVLSTKWII